MSKKTETIINQIEKFSSIPIENRPLFSSYIDQSLEENTPVTFYNWECPPRRISYTKKGAPFINYDIDLKEIFLNKKMDRYTEIPRVVAQQNKEISIISFLKSLNFPFRFIKIVADTNAYYLTPESLAITGEKKISKKFSEFKDLILSTSINYPIKTEVLLFTKILQPFLDTYKKTYSICYKILKENPEILLPLTTLNEQLVRTKKHVGITDKNWTLDFSMKTIATYAAEGIVFDRLSKTSAFSNCVWLNNHEVDRRTIKITNCYRKKKRIGNLPMVFFDG